MKSILTASLLALTAAGAVSAQDLPQASSQWYTDGQDLLASMLEKQDNTGRALNVILFVADGNGVASNYMSRLWAGQQAGGLGDDHVQPHEAFPELALVKTYNINAQTPDSAPTAGAMNTGVKQRFNLINLGEDAIHGDCATEAGNELTLFSEMMTEAGKSVGAVTTARLTHATPAAVYAKTANRNWEDSVPEECTDSRDIATQMIDAMKAGTLDIALGGGARYFVPEGTETPNGGKGHRPDGVNLIEEAKAEGIQYAADKAQLAALDLSQPVLGMWTDSHASYEADRPETEPSLADMVETAISKLSMNENGFYLEVEAGRVDHANHGTNAKRAMIDGKAFADAIALADEMTDDADTLIIVTADHEHAIAMNGYCGRGTPIDGLCYDVAKEGIMHS
ncbi:MAG: alkaline phosphatase, partial [Rhodobacteraceae bacterium]|nr:alkaline phosphatase [Paracoccaceae bacterium]